MWQWHHPQPLDVSTDPAPPTNISDDHGDDEVLLLEQEDDEVQVLDVIVPPADQELLDQEQVPVHVHDDAPLDGEYYELPPELPPAPGLAEVLHQAAQSLHDVALMLEQTEFVPGLPADPHVPQVHPGAAGQPLPLATYPLRCWRVQWEGQERLLNSCFAVAFCPPGQVKSKLSQNNEFFTKMLLPGYDRHEPPQPSSQCGRCWPL